MAASSRRAVSRPGSGGLLPRATPYSYTSATAELIEELGQPWRLAYKHAQILIWHVDEAGTGVACARLSGAELQNGETAMGQVHQVRGLARALGLQERLIVVTLNNSGGRDYELRPDFLLVEEAVREGWCRWVGWRDVYRMEREPAPGERFMRFLREHDVDLLLADLGRTTIWEQDRLTLRILSAVGAEQRADITRRTHAQLQRLWVDNGRGWPGAKRFGFRRNAVTKYLEVDHEQWPFVLHIHHRYAAIADKTPHGLRRLEDELALMGCALHYTHIRRVLKDTIYCDGKWSVQRSGQSVAQRPIFLREPVPWPVYQRNQELLGQRKGKNTRTPTGAYCLNSIELVHLACAECIDSGGRSMQLRGRTQSGRDRHDYEHNSPVPRACYGFRVPQHVIEPAVLAALREDTSRDLQLADLWRQSRPFAGLLSRPAFDEQARQAMQRRLQQLERQRERLERYFVHRLAAGEQLDERDYHELIEAIRAEQDQLKARLGTAQPTPTALGPATAMRQHEQAALNEVAEATAPEDQQAERSAQVAARQDAAGLSEAMNAALSDKPPTDAGARIRRAELLRQLCTRVEIDDSLGDGLHITVYAITAPVDVEEPCSA